MDRHVGKDDGFESLDEAGVRLTSNVFGTSLSGNGTHYWHRHAVGSVNGIYPGVDRKAQGGYVVVPYIMPPQSEVQAPLPEELQGGVKASNVARKNLTGAQLNSWLYDVGEGVPDDEMWEAVEKMQDRGHQQMVASVARVASLAAEGHPGASTALERMQDKWLEGDHNSGDPETDFLSAVRSAIEKFGDRPPDTTLEDKWKALLASVDQASLNTHELAEALRVYSRSLNGDWESNAKASAMYQRCVALIPQIESVDDVRKWLIGAKKIMKSALA